MNPSQLHKAWLCALFLCFTTHSFALNSSLLSDATLRETWYEILANKKTPYGTYQERVELKQGKLFIQTHTWKNEEGYINEEQVGAYAQKNDVLTPLFYNFRSVYRTTETTIDGTVQPDETTLVIKTKISTPAQIQELPPVKKNLPKGAFFAQFFPHWLSQQLPQLKPGKPVSFKSFIENDVQNKFTAVAGKIRLEKPDEFAQKNDAQKIHLEFNQPSDWWIKKGVVIRMSFPQSGIEVIETTKEKAQKLIKDFSKSQ